MEINRSLFIGQSCVHTRRYLAIAAGIFIGTLGLMGLVRVLSQQNIVVPINGALLLWTAAIIMVGIPAVQAYQNEGLLVSVILGLSLPLAFYLVLTTFNLVYPSEDVLWASELPSNLEFLLVYLASYVGLAGVVSKNGDLLWTRYLPLVPTELIDQ